MVVSTRSINAVIIKERPHGMIMAAGGEDASHVEFLAREVICVNLVRPCLPHADRCIRM